MIYMTFEQFDVCMDVLNTALAKLKTLPDILIESSHTYACNMAIRELIKDENIMGYEIHVALENALVFHGWDVLTMEFGDIINNQKICCDIEDIMDSIEAIDM